MNKAALITVGKQFGDDSMFLLSVFDLEPSGIIIHAYNQADSKEYTIAVSEMEFGESGFSRSPQSLQRLLETISIESQGSGWALQSSNPKIRQQKPRLSGDDLEGMMKSPNNGSTSINDTLITGLVELCKAKPAGIDAVKWLGEWLIANNPNKPRVSVPDE